MATFIHDNVNNNNIGNLNIEQKTSRKYYVIF